MDGHFGGPMGPFGGLRRPSVGWQISGYLGIWSYLPATPSILPYPDSSRPLSYPPRIALGSLSSLPQIAFWASEPLLTFAYNMCIFLYVLRVEYG